MASSSEGQVTPRHKWEFAPRFRARAFGWKSQPAIKRVREAVSEIKKMARRDPILGAEGAVLFLEKVSPAIEQVDGSSGSIGNAVNRAVEEMVAVITQAPVDGKTRDAWLERLWDAFNNDTIPYIESLGEHWGDLCVTPARASSWADRLQPTLERAWGETEHFAWFNGTYACLSCLAAAQRWQDLLDLLPRARYVSWSDRQYGVRALAGMGKVDEALAYAEESVGLNDSHIEMARMCESILLEAGRREEAYDRFGIEASTATTRLATFRALARKYPERDPKALLSDLIASTPGDEGKWFATAKELGLLELAAKLAHWSPCDPKTLTRAARDHLAAQPAFALEAALASLEWLSRGGGYDITSLDVRQAYECAMQAAQATGRREEIREQVARMVARDPFMQSVLKSQLLRKD